MRSVIPLSLAAAAFLACGEEEMPPEKMVPSSAQVRTFWGLNSGSCWRYKILGGQTAATVTISDKDTRVIAGKTIYKYGYRPDSSGQPTLEYYLDTEAAPEIRLARSITGTGMQRVVKTYDTDPLPLFAQLEFDAMNNPAFTEDKYETTATPKDGTAEDHKWVVLSKSETVLQHDNTMGTAIKLSYTRGQESAVYSLVPGYGFAKLRDFQGQDHQICNARVCDASGNCTGADTCNNISCPTM